jgi:hypothetical protein
MTVVVAVQVHLPHDEVICEAVGPKGINFYNRLATEKGQKQDSMLEAG